MPQGHTKRDEPVSHLPHSVSRQPVSNRKIEGARERERVRERVRVEGESKGAHTL